MLPFHTSTFVDEVKQELSKHPDATNIFLYGIEVAACVHIQPYTRVHRTQVSPSLKARANTRQAAPLYSEVVLHGSVLFRLMFAFCRQLWTF